MSEFCLFATSNGRRNSLRLRVLESGWITTGPNQALEQAFCQLTGNQHAIAISSATAGMHITLRR